MLRAINSNKAGRSISSHETHWRNIFSASEDSLTSSVFGSLFHLPQELFWKILNEACQNGEVAPAAPRIESVEFWPRWNAMDTVNVNFVEPDIFIRTAEVDFIVECKRYDQNQQDPAQWEKQFLSYRTEFGEDQRKVIMLAVGGLRNDGREAITLKDASQMVVKKLHWNAILKETKLVSTRLDKVKSYLNSIESVISILKETILAFEIHGYATGAWLEDEDFGHLLNINSDPSLFLPTFN